MRTCRLRGRPREDNDPYCGRCDTLLGDVWADLKAELEVA